MIEHYEKNTEGRDFVVGDIHGCFDQLSRLTRQAWFDESKDRLFSVGDLVDRGPKSLDSVGWLDKPWFHAVRGNHEQMAIEAAMGMTDAGMHAINGGLWFYECEEADRERAVKAFGRLPLGIEVETDDGLFCLIHAEVPGDNWIEFAASVTNGERPNNFDHIERFALWGRDLIRGRSAFNGVQGAALVIVGHTPVKEPFRLGNVLYLDTGCVFGKSLSMVCIQGKDKGTCWDEKGPV